jgi:hypothetical protein
MRLAIRSTKPRREHRMAVPRLPMSPSRQPSFVRWDPGLGRILQTPNLPHQKAANFPLTHFILHGIDILLHPSPTSGLPRKHSAVAPIRSAAQRRRTAADTSTPSLFAAEPSLITTYRSYRQPRAISQRPVS